MKNILYGFSAFSWCLFYCQPHLLNVEDVFVCDNTSDRMYFDAKYNYSHSTANSYGYFEVLSSISAEDNFEVRIPYLCTNVRTNGRYLIHSGRLVSKYHPILPYGCWKIIIHVEKPNSNHVEKLCIFLNSAESLKSNDPICSYRSKLEV